MRAEDRESVLDLLESAFGERVLFARYMQLDPRFRFEDFLLDVERGRPVSCVQVFEKAVRLRGTHVLLGGIGSVATAPEARKQGRASELMRRQARAMRDRGMALGLLFTGIASFYEKLGWHARPLRQFALRRTPAAKGAPGREFCDSDLPRVMELYARYCKHRDGTTLRDERYWQANLRYAGTPEQEFRLLEPGGELAAYVRTTRLSGFDALMEYAVRPGHEEALAALVTDHVPEDGVLLARIHPDAELERALARAGLELREVPDRSAMWRVLDAPRLLRLAGLPAGSDDAALVAELGLHYWLADRF